MGCILGHAQLYLSNAGNKTIQSFTPGAVGSVFANTGLNNPNGLAFDTAGNLFVLDRNSTIVKFTLGGTSSVFDSSNIYIGTGLAFDSAGDLYAGSHAGYGDWIEKYTPSGTASLFNGYNAGLFPQGLAFDNAGNLYSANTGGNTISKFTPGGVRTTFASLPGEPVGLAFDSASNLHATTTSNNIRKFSSTGTDLGIFASTGGNQLNGLAFDSAGDLYVADTKTNKIEKFSSAEVDLGVFADSSDGLSNPTFLAFAPVPEPGTALRRRRAQNAAPLAAHLECGDSSPLLGRARRAWLGQCAPRRTKAVMNHRTPYAPAAGRTRRLSGAVA